MYARSPPSSRYYRRRSSAVNLRLLDEEDPRDWIEPAEPGGHCNYDYSRPTLKGPHCRCCSMSASDLLHSPSFDAQNGTIDDAESDWRSFDEEDAKRENGIGVELFPERNHRRSYSRTASIVSTLSSPNILLASEARLAPANTISDGGGNRLRERLAASVAGLKELDILREKHRRMVEEVKAHLKLASADKVHRHHTCPSADGYYASPNGHSTAPRSPSPAELSSNMSHRSSLSMDSGVGLSLASDLSSTNGYRPAASAYYPHHAYHQRRLSTDSFNGFRYNFQSPTRKSSWTNGSAPSFYDSFSNATTPTSDDEGCDAVSQFTTSHGHTVDRAQTYNSLASITAAAEATAAAPRGAAPFRYRRRLEGSVGAVTGAQSTLSRPRSLYNCYPDENTVLVEPSLSNRHGVASQQNVSNQRILRRTSGQYRPQIHTIVANLPDSKTTMYSDYDRPSSGVVCRRRPNGARTSTAADPVFRASRVFIDTLPENEVVFDHSDGQFRNSVTLRPRLYETRRPRPTSVAVPSSVSCPVPPAPRHSDRHRSPSPRSSFRTKPPDFDNFPTRTSSSSTLVRQHSTASAASNAPDRIPSVPACNSGKSAGENATMANVSVVTTGDTSSSDGSSCDTSNDASNSELSNILLVNASYYDHSTSNGGIQERRSISRSVSSQSSDSNKSRRNKEKTWRESDAL